MKKVLLIIMMCIGLVQLRAQSLSGHFTLIKSQTIRLLGFNGFNNYTIDSTQVSEQGNFTLKYLDKDLGMGYISAADNKAYFVVLEKEPIELKGETLAAPDSITTLKGSENMAFVKYSKEHVKREQAISAWEYLNKIYQGEALFSNQKSANQSILFEMQRIQKQDSDFLSNLPKSTYVSWYLPLRKLISSVSSVAKYKTQDIPATLAAYRNINYADPRLYKSGLFKEVLESQYWLLENRALPLDLIYKDMNSATDTNLKSSAKNSALYNEITKYLFDYFEKHSLFSVAEYLALKALSQKEIPLNSNLINQLESYRSMKKGRIAADIIFTGDRVNNAESANIPNRLSEITSKYKLVIFGASWCSACSEEMAQLLSLYPKWKAKGLEVVFISMDIEKKAFQEYTSVMPFIAFCDYKKWDTQAAKDYYVSSSPTIYLLDKNNRILMKPKWIKEIETWLEYNKEKE